MKMFFFNCKGYGECATVMAETKEQAIECIRANVKRRMPERDPDYFKKVAEKMATGDGYKVEEFEAGKVLWTEWS